LPEKGTDKKKQKDHAILMTMPLQKRKRRKGRASHDDMRGKELRAGSCQETAIKVLCICGKAACQQGREVWRKFQKGKKA